MTKIWADKAWDDYVAWQTEDRKTLKRINALIKDIERNGLFDGIGKPEPLKYRKAWSRRIDQANRLVYDFDENKNLLVIACKGHYED
ncbi:MAG: Txe/YoeB family addiction module toxin [Clostridiales bacterium]|jgi:toxin YoeB|nr:Txe/YoeB family addiction module toxin [Clostridiales bacterium]MDR2712487.1 Txe/YoeB family addiction module toxin [Clostridiales bacterium]